MAVVHFSDNAASMAALASVVGLSCMSKKVT